MSKWILKAIVQKAISYLPRKTEVNHFFQKHVTRGVALDDTHLGYKLQAAADHIRLYDRFGEYPRAGASVLELGTGWYPVVPTVLFLAGFGPVVSVDIRNWQSAERHRIAFRRILDAVDDGSLEKYIPIAENLVAARITALRALAALPPATSIERLNGGIGLQPLVKDARSLPYPDGHFTFVCSNNTFEHIPAAILVDILRELHRVQRAGGVMSHFIDLSDHFAHMDASIDIYHFLKFSRRQWALIDNDIQPQNRLRWKDYRRIYADLHIPVCHEEVRPGDVAAVRRADVHPEFGHYSAEELAVSHGYLVS